MEEQQCLTVIIRLLNKLLDPNVVISESQVASLVKCLTGIPGKWYEIIIINKAL